MNKLSYTLLVDVYPSGLTTTTLISPDSEPDTLGDVAGEPLQNLCARFNAGDEQIDLELACVDTHAKPGNPGVQIRTYKFEATKERMKRLASSAPATP